ncbi:hypothetical protein J6590_000200 [Homalodisca vitripennis]|nr:hypothetical protein J6590_000200 [Homalodisca vitripennis]
MYGFTQFSTPSSFKKVLAPVERCKGLRNSPTPFQCCCMLRSGQISTSLIKSFPESTRHASNKTFSLHSPSGGQGSPAQGHPVTATITAL